MSRIPEAMLREAQRLLSKKYTARAERIEFESDDDRCEWISEKVQNTITELYMDGGIDAIDSFIVSNLNRERYIEAHGGIDSDESDDDNSDDDSDNYTEDDEDDEDDDDDNEIWRFDTIINGLLDPLETA